MANVSKKNAFPIDTTFVIKTLLDNNQVAKQKFLDQHEKEVISVIRLLKLHYNQGSIANRNMSLHLLASISELQLTDKCADDLLDEKLIRSIKNTLENELELSLNEEHREEKIKNTHLSLVLIVNLTRQERFCLRFLNYLNTQLFIEKLLKSLAKRSIFDQHGELLVALLLNLTQIKKTRLILTSPNYLKVFLLQFNAYAMDNQNLQTRLNLFGCIKNICFETSTHAEILNNPDFIVRLIWPITGPTASEMDEEDNEQLPLDLQFLGNDKLRTSSHELKKIILECLLLLCAISESREKLRQLHVYFILRGYHRVEKNKELIKALEDVVDILIRDEEEYKEFANLHQIQIDPDLQTKFDHMDKVVLE